MSQSMDNNNNNNNVPPNDNGTRNSDDAPNSDNNNNNNATTATTAQYTLWPLQEIPKKLPSLKESIHNFVITTNTTLSLLEIKYQTTIQTPIRQVIHQLSDTTTNLREQFHHQLLLYQQQRYVYDYGPSTIIGISVIAGGIATVRRGRMAGIVSTIVVGGLSYGIIYGLDTNDKMSLPVTDFSKIVPQRITDLWKSK